MKNRLGKVVLSTLFVASSLMADYSFDVTSLIGVEGGYANLDVEKVVNNASSTKKYNMAGGGIKIGAQTDDFRVYVGFNYYSANDFDYITTYGASLEYLIHTSPSFNLFLGVNTGIANMKYLPVSESSFRTVSDPYYGGEAGVDVHLSKSFDLEFGARYMSVDASNTRNGIKYRSDNMISGYGSVIYKFKMD